MVVVCTVNELLSLSLSLSLSLFPLDSVIHFTERSVTD